MVKSGSPAQMGGDQLTQLMQQIVLSELEVVKQLCTLVGLYRHGRRPVATAPTRPRWARGWASAVHP